MGRISDAMQRAAQNGAEPVPSGDPEVHFVAAEGAVPNPDIEPAPEPGPEPSHVDALRTTQLGLLARQVPAPPLEMVRHEQRDEVELLGVLRILARRRILLLMVVGAFLGVATVYNLVATRVYQARARVVIEPDSPAVVPFRPVGEDTATFDYFLTQLEILRSPALATKVLARLRLRQLPGELVVTPIRSDLGASRVVAINLQSRDPVLAARVVNTLAQTYVEQNLELRRQGSRDAAKWLDERLAKLRDEVNASQAALQHYREQKDSVSLVDQQNIVVQRLAQLSTNVTTARTERLAQQALYDQLEALEASGGAIDTLPPIASNSFIQGLKADLATLQRERAQLAERLGDLHPDMIRLDTAIAAAESRLTAETRKVAASIRNDFRTAQARERALIAALDGQKRDVFALNQQSIGYGALQRDAASTQQIFETVLQRLKEAELSGELQANNVRILDVAEVPRVPVWPRTWLNLLIALLGGSVLAVGLAFTVERLNPRITAPHDISDALGLPLIGVAPVVEAFKRSRPAANQLPPAFQEAIRAIRTRILLSPTADIRTLAVTSTTAGEGKTVIASGLAISLAMSGRRVLLIDADMHRSQLHDVFGLPGSPGLANILAGETRPSEALLKSEVSGLFVLPAGANVTSPSDLLDSDRLTALIDGFRKVFDAVVLDCPPVMALADASIMANAASSVLFVVGAGTSASDAVRAALERLTSVQARVIGAVLNCAKPDAQSSYYYAYHEPH
jgi:polysaccharide biosynthesis transport protein